MGDENQKKMLANSGGGLHMDDILHLAGGTGKYQFLLFSWISLFYFSTPFCYLNLMFLGATPEFRCAEDFPQNFSFRDIPANVSQCYRASGAPCQRWSYNLDTDGDGVEDVGTLVSQWDLVCHRRPMLSTIQSALQFGGLVGAMFSGELGNRIGRRKVILLMCALHVLAPLVSVALRTYEGFVASRFFFGVGWGGTASIGVVLTLELTCSKWRARAGQFVIFPNSIGQIVLAGVAYQLRIWWQLQAALAAPFIVLVLNFWCIPESPRWLILRGRDEEAIDVLQTVARVNGKRLPDKEKLRIMLSDVRQDKMATQDSAKTGKTTGSLLEAVREILGSAKLRKWTAASGLCWLAIGMAYYGLQFDVSNLSTNPYLACTLMGLVDVPTYLSPPLLDRLGRRPVLASSFALAATALLLFAVKRDPTFWLVLGLCGKFVVGLAFNMCYTYTPEYMPTSVRTIGYGFANICLRAGAIVSPFIVDLVRQVDEVAPSMVFGCLCVVASLSALLLPETAGRRLPETVAEVDAGVLDHPEEHSKMLNEPPEDIDEGVVV